MTELKPYSHQVAGRHFKKKTKTLLIDKDYIYKPCSENEKFFYEKQLSQFKEFSTFLPKFYGSKKLKMDGEEEGSYYFYSIRLSYP